MFFHFLYVFLDKINNFNFNDKYFINLNCYINFNLQKNTQHLITLRILLKK